MKLLLLFAAQMAFGQADDWRTYRDPQGRFEFQYPEAFGSTSPGTDDGFNGRAAVRFSEFSADAHAGAIVLGGEAVLTKGPARVDLQAAGGLYDPITLQVFPVSIGAIVESALPPLTAATFCAAIARERHLDPADRRLAGLTPEQRGAISGVDAMGNSAPQVLRCDVSGDTAVFVKTAKANPAGATRHIYGAIRFVAKPYSTFQVIRGTADPPAATLVGDIERMVRSWKPGQ